MPIISKDNKQYVAQISIRIENLSTSTKQNKRKKDGSE